MQTVGKAFKGIQREEVFALVKFRELKDNTIPRHPTTTNQGHSRFLNVFVVIRS